MKSNEKIPSVQIDYITDIIREREQKQLPTFYTIYIEQFGKATPVSEKESGYDNFKQQILKYTSDYDLSAIIVQLFSGKSRNVKAFQEFKILLTKQVPTVTFGGITKDFTQVEQLESSIPVSRYYDEKFELQMRIMRTEMEKQSIMEKLTQITERYDEKMKEQERYHSEKLRLLEEQIKEQEQDIRELEEEISRHEKAKENSFGNIALGSIGSRIIENFAKTPIGTGLLKGVLGKEGYSTLQGHLAGIEQEQNEAAQSNTARVITESPNDPRQIILNYIQKATAALPDNFLRMFYDITEVCERNANDLQVLWKISQQIKQERNKQAQANQNKQTEKPADEEDTEDTDEDEPSGEDDITKIE